MNRHETVIAVFAVLVMGCSESTDSPAPGNAVIDTSASGVIRTINRGPVGWRDTLGWRLEPEVRLDAGGQDSLLTPHAVVATASGDIVVLERTPPRMVVFSASGILKGVIGRSGAGPGEFATGGLLMVVGDTIIHHDRRQSRVQRFLADGRLLGGWPAPCCVSEYTRADTSGRIPIPTVVRKGLKTEAPYAGTGYVRFTGDGRLIDSLVPPERLAPALWRASSGTDLRASVEVPLQPKWAATFSPGGEWVHGRQHERVFVISRNGRDTLRLIEAPILAIPVPDSVRELLRDRSIEEHPELRAVAKVSDMPTKYPEWTDFAVDGTGVLWVLASGPTGMGDHWIVFDREGRLLGKVPAPFPPPIRMYWTADRVYAVLPDSTTGANIVRVYRIRR